MLGDLIRLGRVGMIPEEETLVSEASCCGTSLSLFSGAVVEHDSVESMGCFRTNDGRTGTSFAVEVEGGVGVGDEGLVEERVVMSTTGGDTVMVGGIG